MTPSPSGSTSSSSSASPPSVAAEVTLPFSSAPSSPKRTESISSEEGSDEDGSLYSLLSSLAGDLANGTGNSGGVTIETLKAKLLPSLTQSSSSDGQQTDLGALLEAAKVDLTVEDIVGPPLTQVKRMMEAKGLADWQAALCIKIRRRKKNTVRRMESAQLTVLK